MKVEIIEMGWSDEGSSNSWSSSRTNWRRMKGTDDQIRRRQMIDQLHILSKEGWREWNWMIRWEIFKQLTKSTYSLETYEENRMEWPDERSSNYAANSRTIWRRIERMGWDDKWAVFQLIMYTYALERGEGYVMQWSDKRSSNDWPRSHTSWRGWTRRSDERKQLTPSSRTG